VLLWRRSHGAAEVALVATSAEWQRRGLARALVAEMLQQAAGAPVALYACGDAAVGFWSCPGSGFQLGSARLASTFAAKGIGSPPACAKRALTFMHRPAGCGSATSAQLAEAADALCMLGNS
jgi:GNAT superfamily N-acetyltransferase